MQYACHILIKFHEEYKNGLYFNLQGYPRLKLNEILNQVLLKLIKKEIGVDSRARPTILLYLLIFNF